MGGCTCHHVAVLPGSSWVLPLKEVVVKLSDMSSEAIDCNLTGHVPPCRVKCWAFEPPGGLMTRTVSRALQPICTSTALGNDIVPRLGVATFERLREDMVCADAPLISVVRPLQASGAAQQRFSLL